MRSTVFVIFSAALHGLAVAAVAILPSKISSGTNSEVEMVVEDQILKPGVEAADAEVTAAPPAPLEDIKTPPVEIVKPETKLPQKAAAKPAAKKQVAVAKAQTKKTEVTSTDLPAKETPSEVLDPEITDEASVAVVPAPKAEAKAETTETLPVFHPVKDKVAGVEAMGGDEEVESTGKEIDDSEQAPAEEKPGAAVEKAETTTVAEGGSSGSKGPVSYLDLKQMPGNKAPQYPMTARRLGQQGQVELLYKVTKEGRVTDIQVIKSSGFKELDQEAVKAVAAYRFVPGQEGLARHPVNFALKGEAATLPSRLRSTTNAQAE